MHPQIEDMFRRKDQQHGFALCCVAPCMALCVLAMATDLPVTGLIASLLTGGVLIAFLVDKRLWHVAEERFPLLDRLTMRLTISGALLATLALAAAAISGLLFLGLFVTGLMLLFVAEWRVIGKGR